MARRRRRRKINDTAAGLFATITATLMLAISDYVPFWWMLAATLVALLVSLWANGLLHAATSKRPQKKKRNEAEQETEKPRDNTTRWLLVAAIFEETAFRVFPYLSAGKTAAALATGVSLALHRGRGWGLCLLAVLHVTLILSLQYGLWVPYVIHLCWNLAVIAAAKLKERRN